MSFLFFVVVDLVCVPLRCLHVSKGRSMHELPVLHGCRLGVRVIAHLPVGKGRSMHERLVTMLHTQ